MIYTSAGLVVLIVVWFFANRMHRPPVGEIAVQETAELSGAGQEITVTTWNIGFAGLGAEADLFIDGGHSLRALNRAKIKTATNAIADMLPGFQSDIVLLQEDAHAGFMTRGIDVHRVIAQRMAGYSQCFWPDFHSLFTPKPFRFKHGVTTFSKFHNLTTTALTMPQDPLYYFGLLKKYYGGIVQKYPIEGQGAWVVINIHLSAFDNAARQQQLGVLFAYALAEYKAGNYVVIGGDWNMRLTDTEFPYDAKKRPQCDIYDFPPAALPKGWSLVADSTVPSLRAMGAPYIKGKTYSFIVDGFVVSPNVRGDAVKTHDLQFRHTDHHPVTSKFSCLDKHRV
ncbi:MAG: endonuclease/exonuclease/phosphatase family protein [Rhodobacterales bacterium]